VSRHSKLLLFASLSALSTDVVVLVIEAATPSERDHL
jgi:hypothetical protein